MKICDRLSENVIGEILIVFIKKIAETKRGGSIAMCKMMEDMRKDSAKEKAIEIAIKMLKDNVALEKIAEYSGLSLDEVEKIKSENNL